VKQALKAEKHLVEGLLRMVEETVPIPLLAITNSEHPDKHPTPLEGSSAKGILVLLDQVYQAMRESGVPHSTAIDRLRVMEPFDRFPELVESFREQNQGEASHDRL
jgi:hypothetical protein